MQKSNSFYITTPIYYVNGVPHIGHAYCTIIADVAARFARMSGKDVFFLTGTDEHGQKVEKAAIAKGLEVQKYVDEMAMPFYDLWQKLLITNDDFIRTTEPRHTKVVKEIFALLFEKGDIYRGEYEGWYCVHEETFWTPAQLADGLCPECHREVEKIKEENYFFAASKYAGRLAAHIQDNPEFIMPESRRNEVLKLIEDGVRDVCVSRTAFKWGVPLPFDEDHVAYVWFDALINYLSALGYPSGERYARFWPAIHLIGKDIIKFHAIFWPTMLLALDVELPRQIYAHGFWTLQEEKMSKSKGNVVDPNELIDEYGLDAVRYFLSREIALGLDGEFTRERLMKRINYDLANDFGNMLHRTIPMLIKYCGGIIPPRGESSSLEQDLERQWEQALGQIYEAYKKLAFKDALERIWTLIGLVNKYIDEAAPWAVAKQGDTRRLEAIMHMLTDCIKTIAVMVAPVMPHACQKVWDQLGIMRSIESEQIPSSWKLGSLSPGGQVVKGDPLFPRIEDIVAD